MPRFLSLLLFTAISATALAAATTSVDTDTAGQIYLAAGMRPQVEASLATMPQKLREMFTSGSGGKLSGKQLAAVTAAAKHSFQIDVFEPSALAAFAAKLDPASAANSLAFLKSPTGQRMVRADVALAGLNDAQIDQIGSGKLSAPSTPARDALFKQLATASRSTESAATVYLTIGRSLAVGKAMGYGLNLQEAEKRVAKNAPAAPPLALEQSLKAPLVRYLAYGYRGLSDADLRNILAFLQSPSGQTYVKASIASLAAGFRSMSLRCGERIGESWREIAQNESLGDGAPKPAH